MQIEIGEKIKELRKRDGRKQEELANALGVTAQAVSRWEAGGGYPDINMIPAIANYFHITIDALFGYNNDRDAKIAEYVKEGDRLVNGDDGDVTECIRLMKNALKEFPSESGLQMCLARALYLKGFKGGEMPNIYLEEAATLYEDLLEANNDVILPLLDVYSLMGEYDKAEKKALKQPKVQMSREVLLAPIFTGEKGDKYRAEAILALLHQLNIAVESAIVGNRELAHSKEGLEISLSVRNLYEKIFGNEGYGKFHSDMCMIDLRCAKIAVCIKDYEEALAFFDSAYGHYTKFLENDDIFKSSILSAAGNTDIPVIVCKAEYFGNILAELPEEVKEKIVRNPKYAEIFEK